MIACDSNESILIVGAGQAGGRLALSLLAEGYKGKIILAGDEKYKPYERPPLSKAVLKAPQTQEELYLTDEEEWLGSKISLYLGDAVVAIDYLDKRARFASGREVAWSKLVLATGGHARMLPIPGAEHCKVLRDLNDSLALADTLAGQPRLAIIGGGVIGLEVAATARELGCEVVVIEAGERVMSRVLPAPASDWLQSRHRAAGTSVLLHTQVKRIFESDTGYVVQLEEEKIHADLVLSAIGMRPNTSLVPSKAIGPNGGILTDETGKVIGLTDVFAIGDVAESWNGIYNDHLRLETWRNADQKARYLAKELCGGEGKHQETPWMWTDQLGHNIQVVGLWQPGAELVTRGEIGAKGSSLYWHVRGRVLGGVLFDNGRDRRFLEKLLVSGVTVDPTALSDLGQSLRELSK